MGIVLEENDLIFEFRYLLYLDLFPLLPQLLLSNLTRSLREDFGASVLDDGVLIFDGGEPRRSKRSVAQAHLKFLHEIKFRPLNRIWERTLAICAGL